MTAERLRRLRAMLVEYVDYLLEEETGQPAFALDAADILKADIDLDLERRGVRP